MSLFEGGRCRSTGQISLFEGGRCKAQAGCHHGGIRYERRSNMSIDYKNKGLTLLKKGQSGIIHAVFSRFGLILLMLVA